MRAIIIDDEPGGRSTLKYMLAQFAVDVEVVGEADSVENAILEIREKTPDLIFLDIEMPGGLGFDLFNTFPKPTFQVIFATASNDFAIKAFRLAALDYLLKPIDPYDLAEAVKKARDVMSRGAMEERINLLLQTVNNPPPVNPPAGKVVHIEMEKQIVLAGQFTSDVIKIKEIVAMQADGGYTTVYTRDKRQIINTRPLKQFEDMFEGLPFYRIHKTWVINLLEVKQILRTLPFEVVMSDDNRLEVSRRRKDELLTELEKAFEANNR